MTTATAISEARRIRRQKDIETDAAFKELAERVLDCLADPTEVIAVCERIGRSIDDLESAVEALDQRRKWLASVEDGRAAKARHEELDEAIRGEDARLAAALAHHEAAVRPLKREQTVLHSRIIAGRHSESQLQQTSGRLDGIAVHPLRERLDRLSRALANDIRDTSHEVRRLEGLVRNQPPDQTTPERLAQWKSDLAAAKQRRVELGDENGPRRRAIREAEAELREARTQPEAF